MTYNLPITCSGLAWGVHCCSGEHPECGVGSRAVEWSGGVHQSQAMRGSGTDGPHVLHQNHSVDSKGGGGGGGGKW